MSRQLKNVNLKIIIPLRIIEKVDRLLGEGSKVEKE